MRLRALPSVLRPGVAVAVVVVVSLVGGGGGGVEAFPLRVLSARRSTSELMSSAGESIRCAEASDCAAAQYGIPTNAHYKCNQARGTCTWDCNTNYTAASGACWLNGTLIPNVCDCDEPPSSSSRTRLPSTTTGSSAAATASIDAGAVQDPADDEGVEAGDVEGDDDGGDGSDEEDEGDEGGDEVDEEEVITVTQTAVSVVTAVSPMPTPSTTSTPPPKTTLDVTPSSDSDEDKNEDEDGDRDIGLYFNRFASRDFEIA
ncbi:hypothetical protein JCM10212_003529 [Sporobolomyces blumeae]